QYSYSHNGNGGRLVESAAAENYIRYNRLTSETGTTSSEVSLPNGGRSFVIGNVIEKGPNDQSGAMLAYLLGGNGNPSSELYVVNNTFVNDQAAATTFLNIAAADTTPAQVSNNILYGPGTVTTQGSAVLSTNYTGAAPLFANQAGYDYHLAAGSPAINAGSVS